MRSQLFIAGLSISALGVFVLLLEPLLAIPAPLVLSPGSGPVGTSVSATVSGVQPGARVYLYWFGKEQGNGTFFFLSSGVAGQDGKASSIGFTVPQAFLGVHNVTAVTVGLGPANRSIPASTIAGVADFNLTSSASGGGASGSLAGLSPLTAWGGVTLAAGLVLAGIGLIAKEREGAIEPPAGHRFCPFCSTPVPLTAERCPQCNGVQPKDGS